MLQLHDRPGQRFPPARRFSADLLCLLVALAIFAVVFDTLHIMAYFRAPMPAAPLALPGAVDCL